jgi:uncharacterized phage-associated protein
MPAVSAHDVAAALREMLPGLPTKKLHKLLYYCQGHHLAHFDEPLFTEALMAWDRGPVVATLWKAENLHGPTSITQPLNNAQLNTVAYVVSRYGRLTGTDLERLSHNEAPYQLADRDRPAGGTSMIRRDWVKAFFKTDGGPDADLPWPSPKQIAAFTADARRRRARLDPRARPDTADDILARLA